MKNHLIQASDLSAALMKPLGRSSSSSKSLAEQLQVAVKDCVCVRSETSLNH